MKTLRTLSYLLFALSVVVLLIGGISRVTLIPVFGITARAFLGLSAVLQLYAMTLLLLEIVQKGQRA
ncbi:MAG: hypothetical protein ACK4Z6_01990 [Candidatus Methylomirabilales bacterium]